MVSIKTLTSNLGQKVENIKILYRKIQKYIIYTSPNKSKFLVSSVKKSLLSQPVVTNLSLTWTPLLKPSPPPPAATNSPENKGFSRFFQLLQQTKVKKKTKILSLFQLQLWIKLLSMNYIEFLLIYIFFKVCLDVLFLCVGFVYVRNWQIKIWGFESFESTV